MGSPTFAIPALEAALNAGHEIIAVYCQPPRPAGRGQKETPCPVHRYALDQHLPVRTPVSLKSPEAQAEFAAFQADVAVVAAYGLLLPEAVLSAPTHGCVNIHPSKLPRWRGAAPLQRTIMAGDTETAVVMMQMDKGLDTGAMLAVETFPVFPDDTTGALHDRLAIEGARMLVEVLAKLARGEVIPALAQPEAGITYAAKIDKTEARIDWNKPASELHNLIRGLNPAPGAWCEVVNGEKRERLKIMKAAPLPGGTPHVPGTFTPALCNVACGSGALRLIEIQREGRQRQPAEEWARTLHGPLQLL